MPVITVGKDTFRVEALGSDKLPALMLSNSLGTALEMWNPQVQDLAKRFRVIRYDKRGHGRSCVTPGPYSIAQLGRDALAIMDRLGVKKVSWLGLSLGGMTGMWLLTHAPERINRAVLANTSASMQPPDIWNARIQTVLDEGMYAITQAVLDRWFTREFQARSPKAIELVKRMIEQTPKEGYAACCGAIRDMDQREAIRSITRPVLVITGAKDPSTPPAAGELIQQSIKGAKLVSLNAAHLSNIEQPEQFTRAALDFLTLS